MSSDIGQQMQQLYSQFGQLAGVVIELHKELLAVRITNKAATATVFLQGAQLSHYQAVGQPAIIWCSNQCEYRKGEPLRGGIPICWPWFGDIRRNAEQVQQQIPAHNPMPAHGFVRNRVWDLLSIETPDPHSTTLHLQLKLADNQEPLWPYACELNMLITVSDTLSLDFAVTNLSANTVSFSSALHSYFGINAIDDTIVGGLDGLTYIDCLENWQPQQQHGSLVIDQEVDRIYRGTEHAITIKDAKRRITLQSQGSHSAVVWNPWIEKSKRLSHFADDDYLRMLCIETANAEQDFIKLAPHKRHHLKLDISSST
ncbi:D-hexose-6-phosphate mutarotase [uncultured Oceanicoccus sp.]|uniref:D-hexose-6-phosphate mutarotase n=1 Tax=uncultured Oceanicoccus sp. TaxID=1706381 RepID=UPI0030DBE4C5